MKRKPKWTYCTSSRMVCQQHHVSLVFVGTTTKQIKLGIKGFVVNEYTAFRFKCPAYECGYTVDTTTCV